MKKSIHYLMLSFCLLFALPLTSLAQVHIGASEYSTVKAAFDAINAGTHTGAITITLSGSTSETAKAQLNASGSGSASYTSILIYPTVSGVTISGNLSDPIIYLYGADNVTIDGRVNQAGSMDMVIENISTSTSACALYFNYDACNNTITYCDIQASTGSNNTFPDSGTRGVIFFGSSTSAVGQDNNTISYCNIGPSGSNLPNFGIFSYGSSTAGRENSNITIDHCNIFDYFYNYSGGSSSITFDEGIYLYYYGNDEWNITNNSFYQTATRNKSNNTTSNNIGAIFIRCGDGHVIEGNYIGGSAPECGGSPMTYTGNAYEFHAIKVAGDIADVNAIQINNNTIKNISFTTGNTNSSTNNSVPRFSALHFGKGRISCSNNTIGSTTEQGSIYLEQTNTTFSMYDIWVPAAYSNYTVLVDKCNHNTIAGITMDAPNFDAKGIHVEYYSSNSIDSLCYNTIGSLTQRDNFQIAPNTPSVTRSYFSAMYCGVPTNGSHLIIGNTFANITCGPGGTSSLSCISVSSTNATIAENTIINVETENAGAIYGITGSGADPEIYGNFIANLGSSTSSSSNYIIGINNEISSGTSNIYNNVISLGLDLDGNSYENRVFSGIKVRYAANVQFNTVSIKGNCTSYNSYAYYDYYNSSTRYVKDNIFSNERANTSGSAKHYAVYYYGTGGLNSDYNNYYVSGTGGVLGYLSGDRTTLAALQSATSQDANSVNQNPNFYNSNGNYASDYMLLSALNGNTVAGITTDFGGISRNPTPTMGAWEYKAFIWVGTLSTDYGTAGNWQDNEVPPSGASIEFAASPVNHCILDQDRIVADISNDQTTYDLLVNGHSLCVRGQLNFTNDAEIEASASGSTVNFCGSQAQTIPANAFYKDTIYNLNINNSANLTTNSDLHVQNGMTFTNGKLITGSNMLVLEDDINLSGVSSDSYVVGTVRKKGNDSFVFPIGNDSIYAPIAISAPAVSSDIFTASYFHANPNPLYSISSLGTGIDHVSSNEYWILDRTGGLSNVAVTLTWNEYSGISDLADLRVARWDGSEWSDEGNSGTSGTTVSGSIISNTVTSFSPFTLGSFTSGNPLPVEYFDMSAVSSDDGILIDWSTASETNNDYFVVEKSLDSHVWSEIAFVRGAGNSNMIENYNALDVNPVKGLQYYRIAQNDFNGQISYSKTLSAIWEETVDVSLYPNPATNAMIINFASSDNAVVTVQIMNTLGKTVKTIQQVGNMSSIDISDLSPGVYYMDFPGSNNLKKCRFIKK
ncbi:MAG: T9SS type A sorting domain-containing protein [Bacteroidales bacterium]|nr:T9SS type A sorting domain-containing protein [Bacteroidales bacterium]